jgi:hypothetical protein
MTEEEVSPSRKGRTAQTMSVSEERGGRAADDTCKRRAERYDEDRGRGYD